MQFFALSIYQGSPATFKPRDTFSKLYENEKKFQRALHGGKPATLNTFGEKFDRQKPLTINIFTSFVLRRFQWKEHIRQYVYRVNFYFETIVD